MRSLAGIRARLDELLAKRQPENEPPRAIVLLPANGRAPNDDARPYPRVNRVGTCAIVVYRVEDGQPDAEAIQKLVNGTVTS
jgi:hypothetical protein